MHPGGRRRIVSSSAGAATGAGIEHTFGGKSYKTFAASRDEIENATRTTLAQMSVEIESAEDSDDGRTIKGRAEKWHIEIGFERLTPTTARMSVVASRAGISFRDASTATETIMHTAEIVEDGQESPRATPGQTSEMRD